MLTIILLVMGILILGMQYKIIRMLKHIGKDINQIEGWNGIPKEHYF